jgi:O-acetyl-ADP-ribose deacetylase (regulator of RNase III)
MSEVCVVRGDITRLHEQGLRPDAIVNAANDRLHAGAGVCGAIFAAAGPAQLAAACDTLGGCPTGSAVATPAFRLDQDGVRHIIHAVGPIYRDGTPSEQQHSDSLLARAYRSVLQVAEQVGARRLAVPALSTGIYGFPEARAAAIATEVVRRYDGPVDQIYLVAFDARSAEVLRQALADRDGEPANLTVASSAEPPATRTTERPVERHEGGCESCGSPAARGYDTPDGPARLCPACAALHDVGCP